MLQATAIGHIGGDAEVKSTNGKEFTTFRIAHTDKWTDESGQEHTNTQWIDCTMNGKPAVLEWLKKGQMVCVMGNLSTRIYSSAKDRCMKAGITINVRTLELLGGKGDDIPSVLFDARDGSQVDVVKYYNVPTLIRDDKAEELVPLVSRSQERFVADRNGWVTKFQGEE